jgi:20S proteasome alpha/beta subunit
MHDSKMLTAPSCERKVLASQQGRAEPVTIGIAVACSDGVVVGADRKVTRYRGTRVKSLEDKIYRMQFKDGRSLLACSAGSPDLAFRFLASMNPAKLGEEIKVYGYRDFVESEISALASSLSKKGIDLDVAILFGMVDDGCPYIGHVIPTGLTEVRYTGYFTTGIAAPYAELVLHDTYSPALSVEDTRLIVAGLIDRIGKVDNDVEGMDVFYIQAADGETQALTPAERQGLNFAPFSFDLRGDLNTVRAAIQRWEQLYESVARRRGKAEEDQSKTLPARSPEPEPETPEHGPEAQ